MRRFAPLFPLLLLVSGCTWIDDAQVKSHAGQVDDDGDGVPASEDCDDADPLRSTAEPEIWYDGIDEDCKGDDDYDQDGDDWIPTEFVGLTTLDVKGSGELHGGDCDDQDRTISPAATDTWYDGVDSSCDGGDDYDQDADGYVPDEYAGLVTKYVGTSGLLPAGDCDDTNSAVNPAPGTIDAWYDGLDADCDGANDYDQDADGYVPDAWLTVAGGLPGHDCNDLDDAVNPGVDETWYNGVDDACDGQDDFDRDADGYVRPVDTGKITYTYDDASGTDVAIAGTGALPGDDCDDTDANAHPYAHELYGDAVDEDCDGGLDSIEALPLVGYTYELPYTPIFVEADGHVYLSVAVHHVTTPAGDQWYDSGFAVYWDTAAIGNDPDYLHDFAWAKSSRDPAYDVGSAHSFRYYDGVLYGVLGRMATSYRALAFESYPLDGSTAGQMSAQSGYADDAFEDADVYVDGSGNVYGIGCDGGTNGVFTFVSSSSFTTSTSADVQQNLDTGTQPATACQFALDGTDPYVLLSDTDDMYALTVDDLSLTEPSWTRTATGIGLAPGDIDTAMDGVDPSLVFSAQASNSVYVAGTGMDTFVGQGSDAPTQAVAMRIPGGQYVVVWINSNHKVRLAKGNVFAGFSYVAVNFAEDATGVALWVDASHAMVAVTGATSLGVGTYDW